MFELAVSEACTNAVRHAGDGGSYEVTVRVDARRCVVEALDHGGGFTAAPTAEFPVPTAASGRGLLLITQLVDEVQFHRRHPSGSVLRLVKRLR